jgi:hypothetical protein
VGCLSGLPMTYSVLTFSKDWLNRDQKMYTLHFKFKKILLAKIKKVLTFFIQMLVLRGSAQRVQREKMERDQKGKKS